MNKIFILYLRVREKYGSIRTSQLATRSIDDLIAARKAVVLHCLIKIRVALSGIAI